MQALFEDLTSVDEGKAAAAWQFFFFNEDAVVSFLKSSPIDQVQQVIAAGAGWGGMGWDTTKAAKAVRRLTGVAMVMTQFQQYLNSFLFSLSLSAGLEIPAADLSDKASEVAFQLSERWQAQGGVANPAVTSDSKANVMMSEDDSEEIHLPWELPQVSLEPALGLCLKKVLSGEKFPAKSLLEEVPRYEGLKCKAEENNHGQDGRSPQDKLLKSWQQRLLNMARVVATLYPAMKDVGEDYDVATQQLFFYILETESQVLKERKRRSIPGAAIEVSNALFTQDDLKRNNQVYQVNQAGLSRVGRVRTPLMLYFRNPTGHKSFRFRGFYPKDRGKSQGSRFGPSWRSTWKPSFG